MPFACPTFVADSLPALCRSIDIYCERTGPAFDAEPLNAVTAAAMLVPAVATAWLQVKRPNRDAAGLIWAMIAAITLGAFGATLFHTAAIVWTVWVDMLPFLVFMLLVLWLTLTRFLGWAAAAALIALFTFLALTLGGSALAPPGVLPGSAYYLTPLVVLAASAGISSRGGQRPRRATSRQRSCSSPRSWRARPTGRSAGRCRPGRISSGTSLPRSSPSS